MYARDHQWCGQSSRKSLTSFSQIFLSWSEITNIDGTCLRVCGTFLYFLQSRWRFFGTPFCPSSARIALVAIKLPATLPSGLYFSSFPLVCFCQLSVGPWQAWHCRSCLVCWYKTESQSTVLRNTICQWWSVVSKASLEGCHSYPAV